MKLSVLFCIVLFGVLLAAGLGGQGQGAQARVPAAVTALGPAYSVVYSQPPANDGVLMGSSRMIGNTSDADQYIYDNFSLAAAAYFTQVRWRGARDMTLNTGGPVQHFTVAIYPNLTGGDVPDIVKGPLVTYTTPGNAGETYAGVFNGVAMYDYEFTLPTAFRAAAHTKYWLQIEGWQEMMPDWGIARGTNGNNLFYWGRVVYGEIIYQFLSMDASFSLLGNQIFLPLVMR